MITFRAMKETLDTLVDRVQAMIKHSSPSSES